MLSKKSGASCGHTTIGRGGRSAWSGALQSTLDELGQDAGGFAIAPVGFGLLTVWRAPPLVVVAVVALGGIALAHGMS